MGEQWARVGPVHLGLSVRFQRAPEAVCGSRGPMRRARAQPHDWHAFCTLSARFLHALCTTLARLWRDFGATLLGPLLRRFARRSLCRLSAGPQCAKRGQKGPILSQRSPEKDA